MSAMRTHYSIFAVGQKVGRNALEDLRKRVRWNDLLTKLSHRAGGNNDIDSLLIRPIQRICRYPLLFGKLSPASDALAQTHTEFVRLVEYANSLTSAAENQRSRIALAKRLIGLRIALSDLGDELIVERTVHLKGNSGTQELHAALFSRYLLLAEAIPTEKFSNQTSRLRCKILLELSTLKVYPIKDITEDIFEFDIRALQGQRCTLNGRSKFLFSLTLTCIDTLIADSRVRAEWWIRELGLLGATVGKTPPIKKMPAPPAAPKKLLSWKSAGNLFNEKLAREKAVGSHRLKGSPISGERPRNSIQVADQNFDRESEAPDPVEEKPAEVAAEELGEEGTDKVETESNRQEEEYHPAVISVMQEKIGFFERLIQERKPKAGK